MGGQLYRLPPPLSTVRQVTSGVKTGPVCRSGPPSPGVARRRSPAVWALLVRNDAGGSVPRAPGVLQNSGSADDGPRATAISADATEDVGGELVDGGVPGQAQRQVEL